MVKQATHSVQQSHHNQALVHCNDW